MGYRLTSLPILLLALTTGVCAGCSTVGRIFHDSKRVELTSEPAGAQVETTTGERLGETPLVLQGETLKKLSRDGQINVVLSAPGHLQREILLELHGQDAHEVKLVPFGAGYFSERLIHDFSAEANAMARGLAEIQSQVFARRLNEAEKNLEAYQRRFPNIAASYVLQASVESLRGNQDKARRYLLRARTLDPSDPVAARMLNQKPAVLAGAAPEPAARQPASMPAPAATGPASPPVRRAPASKATAPKSAPGNAAAKGKSVPRSASRKTPPPAPAPAGAPASAAGGGP